MTEAKTTLKPTPRRWRLRFSLRTLVLAVLAYTSLWTATEIYGGRDFRARIEARSEQLRRTTAAWCHNQAREADAWQNEGFVFTSNEDETVASATRDGTQGVVLLSSSDRSVGSDRSARRPTPLGVHGGLGGQTGHGSLGGVGGKNEVRPEDVSSFCEVETLAVAPFLLRVQYTMACVDSSGKSLPVAVPALGQADCDAQGWVFWCFGYAFRFDGGEI